MTENDKMDRIPGCGRRVGAGQAGEADKVYEGAWVCVYLSQVRADEQRVEQPRGGRRWKGACDVPGYAALLLAGVPDRDV